MIDVDLDADDASVVIPVQARAGAKQSGVMGCRQGRLVVAVTEAPEKGRANRAIAALLARSLGLGGGRVELVSGATSKTKRFRIYGTTITDAREKLSGLLPRAQKPQ